MAWKKTSSVCVVLAALAVTGYAQTNTKQRAHSANLQGAASGYLGVGVQDLDAEKIKALNLKDNSGVVVTQVTDGEAGARAGIHVNDVILEINGQKVNSQEQVAESILGKAPGVKVNLTVMRNGARQNMVATLGLRPSDLPLNSAIPVSPLAAPMSPEDLQAMIAAAEGAVGAPRVGFAGVPLGPQLAAYFNVQDGVLVQMVYEKTPAERAGLKAGDIVIKVNGMPVGNPREISGVLRQADKKIVAFTVIRNKKEITLNIEVSWNRPDLADRDAVN